MHAVVKLVLLVGGGIFVAYTLFVWAKIAKEYMSKRGPEGWVSASDMTGLFWKMGLLGLVGLGLILIGALM
ncbi:MAG: hypothetical protein JXP34_08445 [Planctomycetes bacterium]|nr:hypothetical protein [Planctomycetota bacterium]